MKREGKAGTHFLWGQVAAVRPLGRAAWRSLLRGEGLVLPPCRGSQLPRSGRGSSPVVDTEGKIRTGVGWGQPPPSVREQSHGPVPSRATCTPPSLPSRWATWARGRPARVPFTLQMWFIRGSLLGERVEVPESLTCHFIWLLSLLPDGRENTNSASAFYDEGAGVVLGGCTGEREGPAGSSQVLLWQCRWLSRGHTAGPVALEPNGTNWPDPGLHLQHGLLAR